MQTQLEGLTRRGPDVATDEEVVGKVLGGERALFEILMRRYNQKLYRAVYGVLGRSSETEDVMQQAWLSAYAHLHQYRGAASFGTWLVRIGINEALARLRSRRLVALAEEEEKAGEGPDDQPGPEEQTRMRELVTVLEQAVEHLAPIYRSTFVLREVEGLNTAEAAQALGVAEDVVKARLHRARRMLREQLTLSLGEAAREALQFGAERCDRVVAAVMARIS